MLRLAANLSMLFQDRPFRERCHSAFNAGFSGAEFLYQSDLTPRYLHQLLTDSNLKHVLANMDGLPTDKGVAAAAGKEVEFRDRFERSLAAASITEASLLHVTAGIVHPGDTDRAAEIFHKNLVWAGNLSSQAGIALVIEAINQKDVPGYFLRSLEDAVRWCQTLWDDNVYLMFDIYHAGMEGLNVRDVIPSVLPWVKHVQIAGVPGRNEPVMDEETAAALTALVTGGYKNWLGGEYRPTARTEDSLGWMESFEKQ